MPSPIDAQAVAGATFLRADHVAAWLIDCAVHMEHNPEHDPHEAWPLRYAAGRLVAGVEVYEADARAVRRWPWSRR